MFFRFWIISTVICLICLYSTAFRVKAKVKEILTKEQIKELKKIRKHKRNKYPWFIIAFAVLCPVLNCIVILMVGINYEEMEESIIHDYKKELGLLTDMEKAREAIYQAFEKFRK